MPRPTCRKRSETARSSGRQGSLLAGADLVGAAPPSLDFRRQLELAGMQPEDYFGMDTDEMQMAIQSDQFPGLQSASQKGTLGGGSGRFGTGNSGMGLSPSLGSSGSSGGSLASLMASQGSPSDLGPQQARFQGQKG